MVLKIRPYQTIRAVTTGLLLFASFLFVKGQAPTHVAKFDFIDANINGFWQYLPRGYQTDVTQKYPLMIFLHGSGESGATPNQETLDRLLTAGVPKIIATGGFPETFTSGGVNFRFIVISPQIKNGLQVQGTVGTSIIQPSTIDAVINYALAAFPNRIDESRIYLVGLSMGGGAIWDYAGSSIQAAKKIAGVVIAAGAGDLDVQEANNIAAAKLPILTTHNNVDNIVLADRTRNNLTRILSYVPTISPSPRSFFWDTPGAGFDGNHNVWSRTFEDLQPNTTSGGNLVDRLGMTAYDWLLQFTRSLSLPVTWERVTAKPVNKTVQISWSVSSERQVKNYEVERSSDGTNWARLSSLPPIAGSGAVKQYSYIDQQPFDHLNYYRVKEIDMDGKQQFSPVQVVDMKDVAGSIRLYPNPFTDKVEIRATSFLNRKLEVTLLSSNGVIVRKESHQTGTSGFSITLQSLGHLTKGIYYIQVKDELGNVLFKGSVWKGER